ncbi:hypothetical protein ACFT30_15085 [Microbacterium ureisolvens]|uniref:COG1470 family protein n=1 Tax=Microbacterium ureisolvens TaxID=2781186 RepID=UPI00362B75D3
MNVHHPLPRAVVATAVAALLAVSAPAARADEAAPETTWSLAPATADGPDSRISLRHVVEAGQSIDDFVTLTNFSSHPATFDVYASDGLVTASGDFDLLPPGEAPVDGGAWISVGAVAGGTTEAGALTVEVQPETSITIPLTITVPAGATPGDHPAGIVAQFVPEGDGPVQTANRVGVRAHLRVDGDVVAAIAPVAVSASYEPSWNPFTPGVLRIEHRLENSGNVRLGAHTRTSVTGPFGLSPADSSEQTREVLPGQSSPSSVRLEVWPLFLTFGAVTVDPLVVGEDEVDAPGVSASSFTVWTVPWSQLVLLLIVTGAVVLVITLRRRSRAAVQARIDEAVEKAREEGAAAAATPTIARDAEVDADAGAPGSQPRGAAVDDRTASVG